MRIITVEICEAWRDVSRAKLEFADLQLLVEVRELTQAEVKQVYEAMSGYDPLSPEANVLAEIWFASIGIVEGDTQPFHSDAGRAALVKLPFGVRKRIAEKVMGLTGLNAVTKKN